MSGVWCHLMQLFVFLEFMFIIKIHSQDVSLKFLRLHAYIKFESFSGLGFISIDCGNEENYTDIATGLLYVSDFDGFVDTGESHKIPTDMEKYALNQQGHHLRSFTNGTRNCYKLSIEGNRKYLIRASFLYANYDGLNRIPQFDLYLDVNLWSSVDLKDQPTDHIFLEIIAFGSTESMFVCVVNTGFGTPFVSSLELRPLNDDMYPLVTSNQTFILFQRFNIQQNMMETLRYPNDSYDRMWIPYFDDSWETISTTSNIVSVLNGRDLYKAPSDVLKTCGVAAKNGSTLNITFQWPFLNDIRSQKVAFILHFTEIQPLAANQSRSYSIFLNIWNNELFGPYNYPKYLRSSYFYSSAPMTISSDFLYFTFLKPDNSTLPPIVSAVEVYQVRDSTEFISTKEEVEAMFEIKEFYNLKKNWQGDPCAPKNFIWEGVKCTSKNLNSSIFSLDLSNNNLSGNIPYFLRDLQNLQILVLSNNNLNGKIPYFLVDLQNLQILNLSRNHFNGPIPEGLQQKSSDGRIEMDLKGNPDLCYNPDECETNSSSKTTIIIMAVVCSIIAASVIILFVVWKVKRGSNTNKYPTFFEVSPIHSANKKFTYLELITMTRNFKKIIGKGGFGNVYHGIDYRNGSQVAVKMLSSSSAQGSKEFQMEANLLTRIHHKNLVSLVGYCIDKDHLALVYELMERGSLKNYFSGQSSSSKMIIWGDRIRIALEAAQGLDYLHRGCQPAIVHRDVKTDNILLSQDFKVKIADFGLSKIFENDPNICMSTIVKGTFGYIDPEYYDTQMLNEKSDVYSFGVLLELITGQPAIISQEGDKIHIGNFVEPMLERGEIDKIVDPMLNGDYDTNSAWKALEIALSCILPKSIQRPLMFDIVKQLKECLEFEIPQGSTSSDYVISNQLSMIDHDNENITAPFVR